MERPPQHLEENMARVIETAVIEGREGKTRAQQIARLKEWKKFCMSQGAEKITVQEVGPGNIEGNWIFTIHHKSAAAYGAIYDNYHKSTKSHDEINAKWQKTPVLNFKSYGITFEVDEI